MYQTTENAALTMRWMLETDASGRTRPVANWAPVGHVELASHASINQAA